MVVPLVPGVYTPAPLDLTPNAMTSPLTRSPALAALILLPAVAGAQPLRHTLVSPDLDQNGAFSEAVAGVPDVDGDGVDDLLVGARFEGSDDRGAAYVFSGATGAPLYALASPYAGYQSWFGFAVAGVPDLDGDGRGDLLISAPGEDAGGVYRPGRAYVFSGATGAPLHTL